MMPRFFFHVFDGRSVLDTEGTEIATIEQAREEAIRIAGRIMTDEAQRVALRRVWQLDVTDRDGNEILHISLTLRMS